MVGAVDKHVALIGFMGAGKSRLGREVARLTERPFVDTDEEIEKRFGSIRELFERGEPEFRRIEEQVVAEALAGPTAVIALGGGAVLSEATRERLARTAFVAWVPVDVETAWTRVSGSGRPLAKDRESFERLYTERVDLYDDMADGGGEDVEALLLSSLGIHSRGAPLPYDNAALVADERVLGLYKLEPPNPFVSTHLVPSGEEAKTLAVVERLWNELAIERDGWIIAFGGGSTTDVAGFAAATHLRGVRWVAVPTTLVGMVDAAIGGKTGINTELGKNLVGAFHYPQQVLLNPTFLATLPAEERKAGLAEVVKTGLLAGREFWSEEDREMVRGCAAFKAAVCLSDPYDRGRRAILNLGHTFAHALEAGSGYAVRHGDAVALGLLAALRLSGRPTDVVEELLAPEPAHAERDRAWEALLRDKKSTGGDPTLVLLGDEGGYTAQVPAMEVRRALEELIAD